jgi:hypothetical protein
MLAYAGVPWTVVIVVVALQGSTLAGEPRLGRRRRPATASITVAS